MSIEKDIEKLTKDYSKLAEGKNAAVVVGAAMNMIQTCMTYGDPEFQRACAETMRGMGGMMLQIIGKPRH